MTIEQTVTIPPSRRLTIDVPPEIPGRTARVIIQFPDAPDAGRGGRLSERFVGALRLSGERYEETQAALRDGRKEWNRNIF
ncbi:MAG: hypothetical protein LBG84_03105 [Treponema sp.]|jgi:hypothetical protein|nr:hypothetical protein [Treponema sp.]